MFASFLKPRSHTTTRRHGLVDAVVSSEYIIWTENPILPSHPSNHPSHTFLHTHTHTCADGGGAFVFASLSIYLSFGAPSFLALGNSLWSRRTIFFRRLDINSSSAPRDFSCLYCSIRSIFFFNAEKNEGELANVCSWPKRKKEKKLSPFFMWKGVLWLFAFPPPSVELLGLLKTQSS